MPFSLFSPQEPVSDLQCIISLTPRRRCVLVIRTLHEAPPQRWLNMMLMGSWGKIWLGVLLMCVLWFYLYPPPRTPPTHSWNTHWRNNTQRFLAAIVTLCLQIQSTSRNIWLRRCTIMKTIIFLNFFSNSFRLTYYIILTSIISQFSITLVDGYFWDLVSTENNSWT